MNEHLGHVNRFHIAPCIDKDESVIVIKMWILAQKGRIFYQPELSNNIKVHLMNIGLQVWRWQWDFIIDIHCSFLQQQPLETFVWGLLPPLSGHVFSGKFTPPPNPEANLIGKFHPLVTVISSRKWM